MKKIFYSLTCLALLGCQSELSIEQSSSYLSSSIVDILPHARIGSKIQNPLSIDVARQAFNSLDNVTRSGLSEEDIVATHKYVAFTPTNDDELYELVNHDGNLFHLFSYPLDYEVSDGLIEPDPRFMINGYSYRWAYVPIDFDLSSIKCPTIHYYDIFSPDDSFFTRTSKPFPKSLSNAIETISHKICGIELQTDSDGSRAAVSPSGRIRFYDIDSTAYRGVNGLSIHTYRGTHTSYTHCDADGYFSSSDSFLYSFTYEIYFSRTDFVFRKNNTTDEVVLKYSGYHGPLYKDFSDSSTTFYAPISRAAIVYYYKNNLGLRRPPMESDNTARLAIQAISGSDPDVVGSFTIRPRWILNDRPVIKVYEKEGTIRRTNCELYSTTMHELAHASHWRNNQSLFGNTDLQVIESFARGVQWLLTTDAYPSYSGPTYIRQSYTGIFQDLIDGYFLKSSQYFGTWVNDTLQYTSAYKSYFDWVTGFTPSQVEESTRKSTTWNEWQYNLLNDYPYVAPSTDVANAFTYWNSSY